MFKVSTRVFSGAHKALDDAQKHLDDAIEGAFDNVNNVFNDVNRIAATSAWSKVIDCTWQEIGGDIMLMSSWGQPLGGIMADGAVYALDDKGAFARYEGEFKTRLGAMTHIVARKEIWLNSQVATKSKTGGASR